jgi:protein TonB
MYLGLTALVLIAVAVVVIKERMVPTGKQAVAPSNLQMVVQPQGKGLLSVRWNPQSAPVVQAREGRLVVLESNQQPKVVQLQAEELKIGHVYYETSAERLELRLEVVDAAGAVVRESVLALPSGTTASGAPEPASAPTPTSTQTAQVQTPVAGQLKVEHPQTTIAQEKAPPVNTIPDVPRPVQPEPRVFTPPPTPTRQPVEEARAVVLDPSAPLPGALTAPARVNLPQLNVVPPPGARTPLTAKGQPANRTAPVGGSVEPATLIKKVAPIYPAIARTARIQGMVRFTATVDKSGHVQNLQFLSGPQMLIQAASDAVKKWVYRPMMLNGQPSEVITQIEVKFSLTP